MNINSFANLTKNDALSQKKIIIEGVRFERDKDLVFKTVNVSVRLLKFFVLCFAIFNRPVLGSSPFLSSKEIEKGFDGKISGMRDFDSFSKGLEFQDSSIAKKTRFRRKLQTIEIPTFCPTSCPSSQPSRQPTAQPSRQPTGRPTNPTSRPSNRPTNLPTNWPSAQPTGFPSSNPSKIPSGRPTRTPSGSPSNFPTSQPSRQPTTQPSRQPTHQPTSQPSRQPTAQPSRQPTRQPTSQPSRQPTAQPSRQPTRQPTAQPSGQPTGRPTNPTSRPSNCPTNLPTNWPSAKPTGFPSSAPSKIPSRQPTSQPSRQPTAQPSRQPTSQPSRQPTAQPSGQPTGRPTNPTSRPSNRPTNLPTNWPSAQPTGFPSSNPSKIPSGRPTRTPSTRPSNFPSSRPTNQPTTRPSGKPKGAPTSQPSSNPTRNPTTRPSNFPSSRPTNQPTTRPSGKPKGAPTSQPSSNPTRNPTARPSHFPSSRPTNQPTIRPSRKPNGAPTSQPSSNPTRNPTARPSHFPSSRPTNQPTIRPSRKPNGAPTSQPSSNPTRNPTARPSHFPSSRPTNQPTIRPSRKPNGAPTSQPSSIPTRNPTARPSHFPSSCPTNQPTTRPSGKPNGAPTSQPSSIPTRNPSGNPSKSPSTQPSSKPSHQPTSQPTQLTESVLNWEAILDLGYITDYAPPSIQLVSIGKEFVVFAGSYIARYDALGNLTALLDGPSSVQSTLLRKEELFFSGVTHFSPYVGKLDMQNNRVDTRVFNRKDNFFNFFSLSGNDQNLVAAGSDIFSSMEFDLNVLESYSYANRSFDGLQFFDVKSFNSSYNLLVGTSFGETTNGYLSLQNTNGKIDNAYTFEVGNSSRYQSAQKIALNNDPKNSLPQAALVGSLDQGRSFFALLKVSPFSFSSQGFCSKVSSSFSKVIMQGGKAFATGLVEDDLVEGKLNFMIASLDLLGRFYAFALKGGSNRQNVAATDLAMIPGAPRALRAGFILMDPVGAKLRQYAKTFLVDKEVFPGKAPQGYSWYNISFDPCQFQMRKEKSVRNPFSFNLTKINPTFSPSRQPTFSPSTSFPSTNPSSFPSSLFPTVEKFPSNRPTRHRIPTNFPTSFFTNSPEGDLRTSKPTIEKKTLSPQNPLTQKPTRAPTIRLTGKPVSKPVIVTNHPTLSPSNKPSFRPTRKPSTSFPTGKPSSYPTLYFSKMPETKEVPVTVVGLVKDLSPAFFISSGVLICLSFLVLFIEKRANNMATIREILQNSKASDSFSTLEKKEPISDSESLCSQDFEMSSDSSLVPLTEEKSDGSSLFEYGLNDDSSKSSRSYSPISSFELSSDSELDGSV